MTQPTVPRHDSVLGADSQHAVDVQVPWFWSDQYELSLQVAGLFVPGKNTLQRLLKAAP